MGSLVGKRSNERTGKSIHGDPVGRDRGGLYPDTLRAGRPWRLAETAGARRL